MHFKNISHLFINIFVNTVFNYTSPYRTLLFAEYSKPFMLVNSLNYCELFQTVLNNPKIWCNMVDLAPNNSKFKIMTFNRALDELHF